MASKPPPLPGKAGGGDAPVPRHLKSPERDMWKRIVSEHKFDESASLALLRTALESHQRARQCREAIDKDGQTYRDRFNQIRAHPLLASENAARTAFISAIRALNLDIQGVMK